MMPEEPDFTASFSPGERLKAKRTELGISLQEVSNALLIPVGNLEALENNRYEDLPGLTYIVGYWRSYANILDVDISDEIEIHKNRLWSSAALAAYHLGQHADVHQKKSRKGSVILLILLFSGFLGGLWYWQKPADVQTVLLNGNQAGKLFNTPDNGNNATDDIVTNPVLSLPESGKIDQPDLLVDTQEPVGTGMDADVDAQPEPGVPEEPVSGPGDQPDSSVDTREPVVTGTVADAQGLERDSGSAGEVFGSDSGYDANSLRGLKVNVHKTVWIDIRNGQGEKLVFRMVNEGENLEISGSPPFYVYIGALEGVDMFYLGEPVDIPPHSSGQSSRVVVGEYPESNSN